MVNNEKGNEMKTGMVVKVFEDPITCERLEGKAKLLKKHYTYAPGQEFWTVKFLQDSFVCDRLINTDEAEVA